MPTPEEIQRALLEERAANPAATKDELRERVRSRFLAKSPFNEKRVETVTEGLEQAPAPAQVRRAIQQTREQLGPNFASEAAPAARRVMEETKKLQRAGAQVAPGAEDLGTFRKLLKTGGEVGLSALQKAAMVLDTPDRVFRAVVQPDSGREDDKTSLLEKARLGFMNERGNDDFYNAMRQSANPVAQTISDISSRVGYSGLGGLAGSVLGPRGAATGMVLGQLARPAVKALAKSDSTAGLAAKAVDEGLTDLPMSLVQPSSFASFGLAGAGKTAVRQARSIAKRLSLSPAGAQYLEAKLPQLIETLGSSPELWPAIQREVASAKQVIDAPPTSALGQPMRSFNPGDIPPATLDANDLRALSDVLGPSAEFAGKSGLELRVPFAGQKYSVDLSAKLADATGLPEQAARRGMQAVGDVKRAGAAALAKSIGGKGPMQGTRAERDFVAAAARQSVHRSAAMVREAQKFYKESVIPLGANIPKERKKELIKLLDPAKGSRNIPRSKRALVVQGEPLPRNEFDIQPPNAEEFAYMNALGDFFDAFGAVLKGTGTIKKLQTNPVTGRFVPRIYRPEVNPKEAFFQKFFDPASLYNPKQQRRGKGAPLGGPVPEGLKPTLDPNEIVSEWLPRMARAIENSRYKAEIKKAFGKKAPPEAYQKFTEAFQQIRIPVWDSFLGLFKSQQLQASPRFHIVNLAEDIAKMEMAGFSGPESILNAKKTFDKKIADAVVAFRTPAGRNVTYGELRQHMRTNGYDTAASSRDALDTRPAVLGDLEAAEAAARGEGRFGQFKARYRNDKVRGATEVFKDVSTLGLRRLGEKGGAKWDNFSRAAFFIDRMKKGDSPIAAANETARVLYDQAVQPLPLQVIRRIFPFGSYVVRSAENVPRMALKNPSAALAPIRAAEAMLKDRNPDAVRAPAYAEESGFTIPLKPELNELVRRGVGSVGPAPAPGQRYSARLRGVPLEGLGLPASLLEGNTDPLASQLAPPLQWAAEGMFDRNLLTKKPQELPGPTDVLPAGSPLGPAAIQAPEGTLAQTQMFGRAALGPVGETFADFIARQLGAPSDTFSSGPPYSEAVDRRNILRLLDLLSGASLYESNPLTGIQNQLDRPEVQKALEIPGRIRNEQRRKAREKK